MRYFLNTRTGEITNLTCAIVAVAVILAMIWIGAAR